jgi:hypothetical protein
MTHLFVPTLAEIYERYEKVDFIQKQLSELQQELDIYKESLIPYQEEEAQIIVAKDACESALGQLKTALTLTAQIRDGVYLPDFKKEIASLLDLNFEKVGVSPVPEEAGLFIDTILYQHFQDIKQRLHKCGLYVDKWFSNQNNIKIWDIKFQSKAIEKQLKGSSINSQLLVTDCENGWKLVWWTPEEPKLMWGRGEGLREPVFKNLFHYDCLDIIKKTLRLNKVIVGQLLFDKDRSKRWSLQWNGESAILQWQNWFSGECFTVDSLDEDQKKLTGIWQGFDLYEYLKENGVELDQYWYND